MFLFGICFYIFLMIFFYLMRIFNEKVFKFLLKKFIYFLDLYKSNLVRQEFVLSSQFEELRQLQFTKIVSSQ